MGVDASQNYFMGPNVNFSNFYHQSFVETYLSDLNNYHAYGYETDEGVITTIISFYESSDDASWYWNHIRSMGQNSNHIKQVLNKVIEHNENKGRLKFYSMFPKKYVSVYRRLAFSKEASTRYDYFDEYNVNTKHQCKFNLAWQILYTRRLLPVDTVVRCTFLKQEYRTELYNGGNL
jgi:hypothetical protein